MRAYNNEKHKNLMDEFHRLFDLINEKFNVSIALIGKLGIEEFFNKYIEADQIDILIPETISDNEIMEVLIENGYEKIGDKSFRKNEINLSYDSLDKYILLCNIKDMKELIKVMPNEPEDEIKDNPKELIKWVEKQNGYYMFDKENLLIIYKDNYDILEIINEIKS